MPSSARPHVVFYAFMSSGKKAFSPFFNERLNRDPDPPFRVTKDQLQMAADTEAEGRQRKRCSTMSVSGPKEIDSRSACYLHESLTIFTSLTFMSPASFSMFAFGDLASYG